MVNWVFGRQDKNNIPFLSVEQWSSWLSKSPSAAPSALGVEANTVAVGLSNGKLVVTSSESSEPNILDIPSTFMDAQDHAGPSGKEGLLRWDGRTWEIPPYFDGTNPTSTGDLRLRNLDGAGVLAITTTTIPSAFFIFWNDRFKAYNGHQHESISSSQDIRSQGDRKLLLRDDDDRIVLLELQDAALVQQNMLGLVRFPWEVQLDRYPTCPLQQTEVGGVISA